MTHVNNMSWTRNISNRNEFVNKGDEVAPILLDLPEEQQTIARAIQQFTGDLCPEIQREHNVGAVVTGTIPMIFPL